MFRRQRTEEVSTCETCAAAPVSAGGGGAPPSCVIVRNDLHRYLLHLCLRYIENVQREFNNSRTSWQKWYFSASQWRVSRLSLTLQFYGAKILSNLQLVPSLQRVGPNPAVRPYVSHHCVLLKPPGIMCNANYGCLGQISSAIDRTSCSFFLISS
jgi:hypothetical protein